MRKAFVSALLELAQKDRRVVLLTGDLGYMVFEPFVEKLPDRFFNAGVSEQNMLGMATGLAEAGLMPYVYSIVPFVTLRPYEFIRNGPIAHHLPVRIVGVGGGFEYGTNGLTHYGLEDLGVMRIQPGITVVAPADSQQAQAAFLATAHLRGPVYYRLSKDDKTIVPDLHGRFELGRMQLVRQGSDVALVTMGSIANEVVLAADLLSQQGISCTVAVVSTFNPSPVADLLDLLPRFSLVVTAEAHYVTGGIGSFVCEVVAENRLPCRVVRCGVKSTPEGVTGSLPYLYEKYELSAKMVCQSVMALVHK